MEEEWTADANDAIAISLVTPSESGLKKLESFNPKFTYALFEEERIFGYKGLKVNLSYHASDMRPHLSVSSIRKFPTVGDVEAVDVVETMKEFLPGVAFQKKGDFELAINQTAKDWTPPGELIKTIERDGDTYEIWKGSLADAAVKQLVKRIQICVLFYIEGGSYIGQDAEGQDEPEYSLARWSVYFVYKKESLPDNQRNYIFQGYSTVYNFWLFEPPTPPSTPGSTEAIVPKVDDTWELPTGDFPYTSIPHRARISQFVILPPFQGKGIGAMLYNTIYELQIADPTTKEITVEDPNESFDLLRDLCDLKYLRRNVPDFANLSISADIPVPQKGGVLHHNLAVSPSEIASPSESTIIDIDALEKLRVKSKIAPRQFARLVEMHLMSKLPPSVRPTPETSDPASATLQKAAKPSKADSNVYTLWRLLLKQRLYRRNAAILGEFEVTERILKLNETLENVEWEYGRILERLEAPRPGAAANGKRKSRDGDESAGESASKKPRVEDA
ncbi:acyl-CoA N-acyltransferase [Xylariales sp. PMI_506]|nr:acyl-CoA N-acyltransferase [Xylariales sp. PMI_506]